MKCACLTSFSAVLALVAPSAFAADEPPKEGAASSLDDEVVLVDGSALRGRITEQRDGSFVVIMSNDGRVHTVQWAQIARVSAMQRMAPAASLRAPLPPAAEAPPPMPPRDASAPPLAFEMGARLGLSLPNGDYATGLSVTQANPTKGWPAMKPGVPILFDVGARVASHWFVGAFAQYGFLATDCGQMPNVKLDCNAHDVRAGLVVRYHFAPRGRVDPWVGWGLGYEWLSTSMTGTDAQTTASIDHSFNGWNLIDATLGLDITSASSFSFGPYAEITYGTFVNHDANARVGTQSSAMSENIPSTSQHQWISVGVRGAFDFGGGESK
jgi:hypothetical protein